MFTLPITQSDVQNPKDIQLTIMYHRAESSKFSHQRSWNPQEMVCFCLMNSLFIKIVVFWDALDTIFTEPYDSLTKYQLTTRNAETSLQILQTAQCTLYFQFLQWSLTGSHKLEGSKINRPCNPSHLLKTCKATKT